MSLDGSFKVIAVLLLTGFAGSVGHCLGMCGPLVILAGARYPRQGISAAPLHLLYHTGRIMVYCGMGLIAGELGSAFGKAAAAARISGLLSTLIGVVIILAGLSYLGWLPFWKHSLQASGWWARTMRAAMRTPGKRGIFFLGMLNGLLPCGLVYEGLLIVSATGNPLVAGLGMLAFGAATIPALVVFGVGAQMLSTRIRQVLIWAGGALVILVGIDLVLRGSAGLGFLPGLMVGPGRVC